MDWQDKELFDELKDEQTEISNKLNAILKHFKIDYDVDEGFEDDDDDSFEDDDSVEDDDNSTKKLIEE